MRHFLLVLASFFMQQAFANTSFDFLGHEIKPGTSRSWMQAVSMTQIPITVIHGMYPGSVLTLTAGVHGDEFPAIFAMQRLMKSIKPESLHGTLILLHLANLEGFHARRVALSPVDEKNLNRVFPGHAEGSLTEQIAHFVTHQVIAKTDYLIDIHSGSWHQLLLAHVYSPVLNQAVLDDKTLALAKSLLIPHIVLYDERPHDPHHSISLPNTAQTRGKPGVTLEVGQLGQTQQDDIDLIVSSCMSAMQHLHMLQPNNPSQHSPVLYQRLVSANSNETGLFQALVKVGEAVKQGQAVGWVSDYFGQRIATLQATVSGTVLILNQTPPIQKGESVMEIAIPQSMMVDF